jgi:hypothetical protein
MNTEALQINLPQKIFSIRDEKLLQKIGQLINKEAVIAYDSADNPLSERDYVQQIREAIEDNDSGISPDEVLKRISNAYNMG